MTRFLVDAQLPPAVARWLTSVGHEAAHVQDVGLAGAKDGVIWQQAIETGAVILSKDEDFARLIATRSEGPAVVWIRLANARKAELLRDLGTLLPMILRLLARGERLIEIS